MTNFLVIHGPNLNLLGTREPELYGADTLADINRELDQAAAEAGVSLRAMQSNSEAAIVDAIQQARADGVDMVVINPAAYTHSSVAIRDAFLAVQMPFVELHLSNVYAREAFRKHSYLSDIAVGVISGFGKNSYLLALEAAIVHCNNNSR